MEVVLRVVGEPLGVGKAVCWHSDAEGCAQRSTERLRREGMSGQRTRSVAPPPPPFQGGNREAVGRRMPKNKKIKKPLPLKGERQGLGVTKNRVSRLAYEGKFAAYEAGFVLCWYLVLEDVHIGIAGLVDAI